ncbi:GNAT family N-acetyltransferase [Leuconostoc miyukkimchii]|uniref:GNAT family N-acetyltransferase n=1 Tax=Leuconostoc miyukkimchii TaxID=910540 RepID=UPI001C7D1306|nr:GNAT family N-acetyltransferase [Leuconostoc miyukkimchii]
MTIEIKHQIGLGDIHEAALNIRKTVFVLEQGVPLSDELDNQIAEESATHIVAYLNGSPVATARVLEEHPGIWHIQRVATLKPMRGQGLGSQLLAYIEALASDPDHHIHTLELGAQITAKTFYEKLNFQTYGSEFLEAGIMHINMKKELK